MANEKKVLDQNGLLYYHNGIKALFQTDVAWDSTNKKLTKTKNSITSDVVTASTLKTAMELNNVGNFKAVSTVSGQVLSTTEQGNARDNIGVDITSFVTDVAWDSTNKKLTATKNSTTSDIVNYSTLKTAMELDNVGNFKAVSTVANQGLSDTEKENARANLGINIEQLYKFKGTVATVSALDTIQNPETGDVYNVTATGKN